MTDYHPRLFADDAAICHIGEGLVARTLPKSEWTHEAHLAASTWLVRERPDIDVDANIRDIISRYNESVGGVNDDKGGYHETITRTYVHGVRLHLSHQAAGAPLVEVVNALLQSPIGRRDWPLNFYSPALLFSVAARRHLVPPDLAPLPPL